MEKVYELGATDYIKKPFESYIVNRRVKNALVMFERQRKLINLVEQQLQQRLNNNTTLINVLGHIVEFRNNESGLHVQHIQTVTKLLLLALTKRTDKYKINDYDILKISTASSLHDVGKIAIDEKIINKPGKLTSEEFEIMKTHTVIGAEMIQKLLTMKKWTLKYCLSDLSLASWKIWWQWLPWWVKRGWNSNFSTGCFFSGCLRCFDQWKML